MTRFGVGLAVLVFMTLGIGRGADDKAPASIKEVMGNHKKDKLRDQIGADLKKDKPDWEGVQKKTKEYLSQLSALEKLAPPKGDKESWKKQTGALVDLAKSLNEAAGKKESKAALAAHQNIGKACLGCHKAHRQ